MELTIWIAVFLVSLAFLIKSSDYFTDAAEKVGFFFKIPPFIIGVSIVAFGTSLPELVSSIYAVVRGSSAIVIGNVIGSNITNVFLILGLTAILGKRITLHYNIAYVDLPLLVGSAFLFGLMVGDRHFSLFEALLSIAGILIYLFYAVKNSSEEPSGKSDTRQASSGQDQKVMAKLVLTLVLSGVFIYFSAKYTVESIVRIAAMIKVGEAMIAASAVALGTSLPELVVSVTAARKGRPAIAIGNILGSNIFNTFAVMGIPALFGTLEIPSSMINYGMPIMIIATLLFFFITQQKRITRWEGMLLILFYLFYLGKLFNLV